jgi:CO dehydrogenase/acetyl-CoA synthase beta subunit
LCEALNEAEEEEEEEEEEEDDDDDEDDEEEEAEGLEAVASFINLPCSRISLRIVSRSALPSSYLQ